MKQIILTTALIVSAFCAMGQTTITGHQQRIPSQNAELSCEPLYIKRTMLIDSVSGSHNGFWIKKNGKIEKAFWNERHAKQSIGYILKPGTYYIYPNLIKDIDTATVTIWLKEN